jgi:hypothetical protein
MGAEIFGRELLRERASPCTAEKVLVRKKEDGFSEGIVAATASKFVMEANVGDYLTLYSRGTS